MEFEKLLLFLLISFSTLNFAAPANVSAIYAFGDAAFDSGNNNRLPTICRADHKPYGIDFPGQTATGRFSDGLLPSDMLVSSLGIKTFLPAYLDPTLTDEELTTGVSFACACSGYDELTAASVGVLGMTLQYMNFEKAYERMQKKIGLEKAVRAVENALYVISAGSNDMMDNYYAVPARSIQYSVPAYHDYLLENLENFIKKIQKKGAKRIAVIGMLPLGCLPMDGAMHEHKCVASHNSDAQAYNAKLRELIKHLVKAMPGTKLAYVDVYNPFMDMIKHHNKFGFVRSLEGCCGTGSVELGPLCGLISLTCADRSKYLFWDSANPTQAAYEILTKHFQDNELRYLLS